MLQPLGTLGARALGNEVEEAAHAPPAIDRRWRSLDHLDVVRGRYRRLEIAAVLHSTKSAEEVVADIAAQEHATRNPEIAARERPRGYRYDVVDGFHAVAQHGFGIRHLDGTRNIFQLLIETEDTLRGHGWHHVIGIDPSF